MRISLTDKCNLRCFYCMPESKSDASKTECSQPAGNLLETEEILEIAGIFVHRLGIKKIRITGGEPLVRKDAYKLIEALSQLPVELGITTNGVFLDRFLPLFKRINLSSLNISLDSLREKKFNEITKRDLFHKVNSNIHKAMEQGFHVKVNAVAMRGVNDDEFNDFVEWTRDSPVHIRFIEFMPFSGNSWQLQKVLSYKEILNKIGAVYPLEKLQDTPNSTAKSYRVKGFKGTFAVISSITDPFCSSCNRIRLTADGKLKNCLFSNDETDLLTALRNKEDIVPLIRNCIFKKFAERGGLEKFSAKGNKPLYEKGRSMTAIGG